MGAGSLIRILDIGALKDAVAAVGFQHAGILAGAAGAGAGGSGVLPHGRLLVEEGGAGLSAGTKVAYIILSVLLVAISGLMAGLVLGLLSLDKVDLEVAKRTGTAKQRWLVDRVEPFTRNPHYTMCALVVVNAACNTALPLFIDRLLNPLAAILISVTAVLIFAEIAPQAVCKRYGLEIGAYCSWLVRGLMVATAPVSWPLGKLLDWLLGEESALFRRQELKALVGLHAEPQQDGSVGALTSDEVQVIQGALDLATKTADAVMTPLSKVFMLSSEAVINKELLAEVISAGHSRVPVHEGDNKQAILGLILVKELVLVDEMAGVRVRELRLREMPFLRADIPLYDVLKIFRFGRRHMACLTRVTADLSASKGSALRLANLFRRPSATTLAALGDKPVEEVVGIITIEDVLEELLQAEIVDETDQYEDNLQTVHVPQQVSLKELPPNLRRFLSPRRSQHGFSLAGQRSAVDVTLAEPSEAVNGTAAEERVTVELLRPAVAGGPRDGAAAAATGRKQEGSTPVTSPSRRPPSPSLGAAGAASALAVAGGPASKDPAALAAAVGAGMRAAELVRTGSGTSGTDALASAAVVLSPVQSAGPTPHASPLSKPGRPPLPPPFVRLTGDAHPGHVTNEAAVHSPASTTASGTALAAGGGLTGSTTADHVTIELEPVRPAEGAASSEEGDWGRDPDRHQRPLIRPNGPPS